MKYVANYCEENVWHLCRSDEIEARDVAAMFISNRLKCCPLWGQKAAEEETDPVCWDYHVVLVGMRDRWMVWDLDTIWGFPVDGREYLEKTFERVFLLPEIYRPQFRLVSKEEFLAEFTSDRSHMIDENGEWLAPPPRWPIIGDGEGTRLDQYLDFDRFRPGEVVELRELGELWR